MAPEGTVTLMAVIEGFIDTRDILPSEKVFPFATIDAVLESYAYVTHLIDKKSTTLDRLRKLLFGASSEKTAAVLGRARQSAADGEQVAAEPAPDASGEASPPSESEQPEAKQRRPGHGRNGAADYPGAARIPVPHEFLQPGDSCPACLRGTAYAVSTPGVLIRFVGQPPLQATIYATVGSAARLTPRRPVG